MLGELRLLILINGWSGKHISGGDYHILRVIKDWSKDHQISFIMPKIGHEFARTMMGDSNPIYFSSKEEYL